MSDWTEFNGRSNSSVAYYRIASAVADILADHRLEDSVESTARLIVAQLAHVHGLAPTTTDPDPQPQPAKVMGSQP